MMHVDFGYGENWRGESSRLQSASPQFIPETLYLHIPFPTIHSGLATRDLCGMSGDLFQSLGPVLILVSPVYPSLDVQYFA